MAKLKEEYTNRIIGEPEQKLGTTNRMLVPRLQKIVVNMGFGIVSKDEQKGIVDDLTAITGQRPLLCKAKKSISNFKLREGMVIGAKVTLRGDRMWDFAERLINAALPRIRDFRGVPNRGFDGRGNYTLGLKEHAIFPELVEATGPNCGMDVTFVTTSKDNKAAKESARGEGQGREARRRGQEAPHEGERPLVQPLPHLRPPPRVHAEVRRVPSLLPRTRGERPHPRRHQGLVVNSERN